MDNRIGLLQWVLGEDAGYLAIGMRVARDGSWHETVYKYPDDLEDVAKALQQRSLLANLYFCPTLLSKPRRVKGNVHRSNVIWADLDECHPDNLRVKPTLVVQTSMDRYQAFWKLREPLAAQDVEAINKRIAYAHADQGCDKSGWDLTQYLRIPGTKNFKYQGEVHNVKVLDFEPERLYEAKDFDVYPDVETSQVPDIPMPDTLPALTGEEVLQRVSMSIHPRANDLFTKVPQGSWSENLFQLEMLLIEAGVALEEVFIVARDSAANKFKREGHSNWEELLWKDVIRAKAYVDNQALQRTVFDPDEADVYLPQYQLLSDVEREFAKSHYTIVDEYLAWAKSVGDAAPEYHEASAFMLLSSLVSGSVKLPTSFGIVQPNLWFMILAETTLTRKTTAMDMAMDILDQIDPQAMLATDGSIEGLLTSLSTRPGQPSVFLRDEFSGLLEQMTKKDYMAGMLAMFTKLYDGKVQKRLLRKETIEVRDPVLILFTGGIKERIYELLTYEHIDSGFVPRFIFVTAEADINRIRPLGPPTVKSIEEKLAITEAFQDVYLHWKREPEKGTIIFGPGAQNEIHMAELSPEAWVRYNKFEYDMLKIGTESSHAGLLTPVMQRLCVSGLKAAVLLAATRLSDKVVVTESDLIKAFWYIDKWKDHSLAVVMNAGKTGSEKQLERITEMIANEPGILRSSLMQRHRLTSREASGILETLQQRGLVRVEKSRGERYYPTFERKVKSQ